MNGVVRPFKMIGTGEYLPRSCVLSIDLDRKLGRPPGWCEGKSKVRQRHFAEDDETFSFMAAQALQNALTAASIPASSLDLIISASASAEQPLPYQASAIQRALGLTGTGIPCFDVNTTCLSFVTALDIASLYLQQGIYRRIAIVSSELPSAGLNWKDPETAPLFGDGAAAVIVEARAGPESGLIASHLRTYSEGYEYCVVRAGASRWNFRRKPASEEDYMFSMHGRKAFKLAVEKIDSFLEELFRMANTSIGDVDLVVPHQASPLALAHMKLHLKIPAEKMMYILETHGNQVAASIPIALGQAIRNGRIKTGQTALLIGTSAGLSIGAALVRL
jgi:3-oxoacyl-[acyl-carrier-protein] synthase-3